MGNRLEAARRVSFLLVPLAAAGCVPHAELAVAPNLVSTEWSQAGPAPAASAGESLVPPAADLGAALGSGELARLIAQAREANSDIGVARARVRQARALFGAARGAMLPVINA